MRLLRIVSICLPVTFIAVFSQALAEDYHGIESLETVDLSKLPVEEIIKRFGEPDKKSSRQESESWQYGHSTIFITNGHVSAWSDAGELAERQLRASLSQRTNADFELPGFPGWQNDWTAEEPVSADQVVDEIIETE